MCYGLCNLEVDFLFCFVFSETPLVFIEVTCQLLPFQLIERVLRCRVHTLGPVRSGGVSKEIVKGFRPVDIRKG